MPHLYSHPCQYRKIFLGSHSCIGFVPGFGEHGFKQRTQWALWPSLWVHAQLEGGRTATQPSFRASLPYTSIKTFFYLWGKIVLIIPLLQNFPLEGKLCLNPVFTFPSRGWALGGKFLCFFPYLSLSLLLSFSLRGHMPRPDGVFVLQVMMKYCAYTMKTHITKPCTHAPQNPSNPTMFANLQHACIQRNTSPQNHVNISNPKQVQTKTVAPTCPQTPPPKKKKHERVEIWHWLSMYGFGPFRHHAFHSTKANTNDSLHQSTISQQYHVSHVHRHSKSSPLLESGHTNADTKPTKL